VWSAETVFVCALALLGRAEARFPAVEFIDRAPPGVSRLAQAYIKDTEPRIVLITSTSAFVRVRREKDRCRDLEAIREIAGVLAHEEWHVLHGPDEAGAYNSQLTTLLFVGADQNGSLYHKVMRAKQAVLSATTSAGNAGVVARNGGP
jgi:hypothetical protein